jgi:hypothetical protein
LVLNCPGHAYTEKFARLPDNDREELNESLRSRAWDGDVEFLLDATHSR